ncbi:putative DNA modification/repair radical SAM protein [Clostridium sp.]|uniref:putative DNA modification/repair radical SAM protein n=1 Tax=Clostridium sp. TaxID=1506 RepID=UPI0034642B52
MDLIEKLAILSSAAKYDASCSSSGSKRKNLNNGLGNASNSGICHSFTPDGRCISLLKILLTNYCIYDCKYCINRSSNDIERAAFTPYEIADLTINFYKRNYIEGLFLSSAIFKNPNYTMELLVKTLKLLRRDYKFNGYIHVKAIPGADDNLIKEAGLYADRMSVNIELPSSNSLKLLAPQKKKDTILKPMNLIKNKIIEHDENKFKFKSTPYFSPGGQSTQLIVGASPESDFNILTLTENLYKTFKLRRVYYSGYVPVNNSNNLPKVLSPPLLREHRLYQGDWLVRLYGFKAKELLNENNPNFDIKLDPKTNWALNNLDVFPIEINKAPYETLIRIPGIGFKSARRIILTRRVHYLSFEDIKKLGVVIKRAKYFITCKGKYFGDSTFEPLYIRNKLENKNLVEDVKAKQLSFFSDLPSNPINFIKRDLNSRLHGDL